MTKFSSLCILQFKLKTNLFCTTILKQSKCFTIFQRRLPNFRNKLRYKGFFLIRRQSCTVAWPTACDTHLGSIKSGTVTGRNATSEKAHFVQRSVLVHLGQRDVGHYSVLRERAGPHEVKHLLSLASEAWSLVRKQALALRYSAGRKHREKMISLHACVMKINCCTLRCRPGRSLKLTMNELWFRRSWGYSAWGCEFNYLGHNFFFLMLVLSLKNIVSSNARLEKLGWQYYLIFWQRLVLGFLQNLHSPHCGTYNGMTVSPWKRKVNN